MTIIEAEELKRKQTENNRWRIAGANPIGKIWDMSIFGIDWRHESRDKSLQYGVDSDIDMVLTYIITYSSALVQ